MAPRYKKLGLAAALAGLALHFALLFLTNVPREVAALPIWFGVVFGGSPFLIELIQKIFRGQFGADLLAALSVITATIMGQLIVASIIVVMLAGGQLLEELATRRASRVLDALAKRTPAVAHRLRDSKLYDIAVSDIAIGDVLTVFPHEICPVDGTVTHGTGTMDESFLTGEPFRILKTVGSQVISGALNGDSAVTIVADKLPEESRYAQIVQVIEKAEKSPPRMRRLGDQLGAIYTPFAVTIAIAAWLASGDPHRFLAVLVIATPCPLLLAIPVAIVGAVSLAAKHSIVIKKPVVLEQLGKVRTMLFDKTGTLTHGQPALSEIRTFSSFESAEVLRLASSLEQYSKHPLSAAVLSAAEARHIVPTPAEAISERPGEGLNGQVGTRSVTITGRKKLSQELTRDLPPSGSGMECILLVDGRLAGFLRFDDKPRREGKSFMHHLKPKHRIQRLAILSGDREPAVRSLAESLGITNIRSSLSPEEKLSIVSEETKIAPTLFLGDGVNDAPAMLAATVGVAFGRNSDITAEAAGAVVLDASLERVDQLLHIGRRMRTIALESALGGMFLSILGMGAAAFGLLPPIWGALAQEAIDLLAVLNALRVSLPTRDLQDFRPPSAS
ncbi:MAG TPA: heavy metal translocating P-type ATPase [Terriglobales bacterium]|nr:heavy metal translocating P-type ATPase [Terriglobales bacterium]